MSEAENTGEEVLRTFVLEDPEGSVRALRALNGTVQINVVAKDGERKALGSSLGYSAKSGVCGYGLEIMFSSRGQNPYGTFDIGAIGVGPHVYVRVHDGCVWVDGEPRIALTHKRMPSHKCSQHIVPRLNPHLFDLNWLDDCEFQDRDFAPTLEVLIAADAPSDLDELWPLERCERLRHVEIRWEGSWPVGDLSFLSGLCTLRTLSLHNLDCTKVDISAIRSLPALQVLRLREFRSLLDVSVVAALRSLSTLDLSGCWQLADLTPIRTLAALRTLDLTGCASLSDLAPIAGVHALQTLNLRDCPKVHDLSPLSGLRALEEVNLRGCKELRDLSALSALRMLRTLDVSELPGLRDISALAHLEGLVTLRLRGRNEIEELSALSGLFALQELDLRDCRRLSDVSALRHLGAIRVLNLEWCWLVEDFTPIADLASLEVLNLRDCLLMSDLTPIAGLASLEVLNLRGCYSIDDISPLAGLRALRVLDLQGTGARDVSALGGMQKLHALDLSECRNLTRVAPLRSCRGLNRLDLSNCGDIRDLDSLSELPNLRELKWTETAAPHSVLASSAVLRGDAPFVERNADDWLSSVRLSKSPDAFGLRLGRAFALGGSAPWAASALRRLASALRDRARDDEDPLVITPHTWAAWADAALALEDDALRAALDAALGDLTPREIAPVLTPVLTALADVGPANAAPRRAPPPWLVCHIRDVLAPFAAHEAHARQAAPAAAGFFAGFGLDDEVRAWLDRGTHPDAPLWRDRVVHALLVREARNGDLAGARRWLGRIATDEARDAARAALAEAFAARLPAEAAAELDAIGDDALRGRVARQLGTEPALLAEPAGLYALVLALQDDADALGAALSALVEAHPGSALVAALARDLAPEPPAAPVAADPLPDVIAHPAWKEEVAGRKWEAFAGRLPPARVLLAEAVAARAVSAGLLDGDVAGEVAGRVG